MQSHQTILYAAANPFINKNLFSKMQHPCCSLRVGYSTSKSKNKIERRCVMKNEKRIDSYCSGAYRRRGKAF